MGSQRVRHDWASFTFTPYDSVLRTQQKSFSTDRNLPLRRQYLFVVLWALLVFIYSFLPATNICLLYGKLDLQNHSDKTTVLLVFPVTIPGGADLLHSPDNLWDILDVPLHCLFSHFIWWSLQCLPLSRSNSPPHLPFCFLTVSSPTCAPSLFLYIDASATLHEHIYHQAACDVCARELSTE